jgi:[phosphatase 2A protein]-leucine-carboxy methyltransferase
LKTYVELDFPEITTKKAMAIKKSKELLSGLGDSDRVTLSRSPRSQSMQRLINIGQGGTALHSARFHLLPVDLRIDPSESLEPLLFSANADNSALLDPSVPTLLVFECVLVYMSPESSSRLLRWFVEKSRSTPNGVLGSIVYEMFGLNDAFGRVMVNNLKASVPSVRNYTTLVTIDKYFRSEEFPCLVPYRIQL